MKTCKKIFPIFLVVLFLCGCSNNIDNEENLPDKVYAEIEYFDSKIVNLLNNLNNISFQNYRLTSKKVELTAETEDSNSAGSESQSSQTPSGGKQNSGGGNSQTSSQTQTSDSSIETIELIAGNILTNSQDEINWNFVKTEIELLNTAWSVALYDIYKMSNSNDTQLVAFSDTVDKCIISIKNQNKAESITNLAQLYSYIPQFVELTINDKNNKSIRETKSNIINAYAALESDDWASVQNSLLSAEQAFSNVMRDLEYVKNNQYKINKTYVLIKEIQNCIKEQDKSVFYMKYINLMESINTL